MRGAICGWYVKIKKKKIKEKVENHCSMYVDQAGLQLTDIQPVFAPDCWK